MAKKTFGDAFTLHVYARRFVVESLKPGSTKAETSSGASFAAGRIKARNSRQKKKSVTKRKKRRKRKEGGEGIKEDGGRAGSPISSFNKIPRER